MGWVIKQGHSPNKWMLRVTRLSLVIFHQVFFLSVANFFLVPWACDWWGEMLPKYLPYTQEQARMRLIYFPEKKCLEGAHAGHAGLAAAMFVLHTGLSLLAHMRYVDIDVTTALPLHYTSHLVTGLQVLTKLFIAINMYVMSGWRPPLAAFLVAVGYVFLWYLQVFGLPSYSGFVDLIASGWYTAMTLAALALFAFQAEQKTVTEESATLGVRIGFGPAILLGFALYYYRIRWLKRTLRNNLEDSLYDELNEDQLYDLHNFPTAYEAECMMRAVFVSLKVRPPGLTEQEGDLAMRVLEAAAIHFPDSCRIRTLAAIVATHAASEVQSGHNNAERAGKMNPRPWDRLALFLLSKRHEQRQSGQQGGESMMDIVSYVEFQNAWKSVIRLHKSALKANRTFWQSLLSHEVRLSRLAHNLNRAQALEARVDQSYRSLLERYPKSVRLLRAYSHFLDARHDTTTAARYLQVRPSAPSFSHKTLVLLT